MVNTNSKPTDTMTKLRYEVGELDSGTGTIRTYFRYFDSLKHVSKFSAKFGHTMKFVSEETFERHTVKEW